MFTTRICCCSFFITYHHGDARMMFNPWCVIDAAATKRSGGDDARIEPSTGVSLRRTFDGSRQSSCSRQCALYHMKQQRICVSVAQRAASNTKAHLLRIVAQQVGHDVGHDDVAQRLTLVGRLLAPQPGVGGAAPVLAIDAVAAERPRSTDEQGNLTCANG